MRDLNISTIIGSNMPVVEQLPLIKAAGFDGFFTTYTGSANENIDFWAECAHALNLNFETVHAPFQYANRLWEAGSIGKDYLHYLEHDIIDACNRIHVFKCVMHVTVGNTAPPVTSEGLALFQELCDYAKSRNVHLAFENLEPLPHIDCILSYITDPFHGFCWDCGHNACYTPHIDMMKKFGSRLQCIHVHDNYGVTQPGNIDYRDDRHFLPFDGILDWDWFAEKLNSINYKGPLTLEVSINGKQSYRSMPLADYIKLAYERGCRLREKLVEV